MTDSVCNSPARSIGEPHSLTDSELTDIELESLDCSTSETLIDGWIKFRDNKRVSKLQE